LTNVTPVRGAWNPVTALEPAKRYRPAPKAGRIRTDINRDQEEPRHG